MLAKQSCEACWKSLFGFSDFVVVGVARTWHVVTGMLLRQDCAESCDGETNLRGELQDKRMFSQLGSRIEKGISPHDLLDHIGIVWFRSISQALEPEHQLHVFVIQVTSIL